MVTVSCTKSYFPENEISQGNAISFAGRSAPVTKANSGADAADLLDGSFTVYGAKTQGSNTKMVFNGYKVNWIEDSWKYVEQQPLGSTIVQAIKYWDNNASKYDFVAFSQGGGNATFSEVNMGNIGTDSPIYTITGQPNNDQLYPIYLADIATVAKANYGKNPVTLNFRPFRTRIRFGMYETVPGYSVTDVCFYHTEVMTEPGGYPVVYTDSNVFPSSGNFEYSVYASGADRRLSVQYTPSAGLTFTGNIAFQSLDYSNGNKLGTSSAQSSYFLDENDNTYVDVLPIGDNSAPICIRVDYTLVPLDGSDTHSITVKNATAVIPAEYVRWQPGCAYTYLFKISEESGGLYPITFDAEQYLESDPFDTETTEIDIPITVYQKGMSLETQGVFSNESNIYITVGDYRQLQKRFFIDAGYVRLYYAQGTQPVTEASVQNCIDNGGVRGRPNVYSVTDASGKTLSLTDVTDRLYIQSDFEQDDKPGPDNTSHNNAIARISSSVNEGTYVFVYNPDPYIEAQYNTLPKGQVFYEYEEEEYDDGNAYNMRYFKSDGTEQSDQETKIVKDLGLYSYECISGPDYDGYNYKSSNTLPPGLPYFFSTEKSGKTYYVEYTSTGVESLSDLVIQVSGAYRLEQNVYFENYETGYVIQEGEPYFEVEEMYFKQYDPPYLTGYAKGSTYPIVITESNKNSFAYAVMNQEKITEFPSQSGMYPFVRVTSANNTKLKAGKWYYAVDGLDILRNDDGTYDDGTVIYVEEYLAEGDESSLIVNLNHWGNDHGLWYDGCYGVGSYYPFFCVDDDYNTLAPGNYVCYSNSDNIILRKFTAVGNETPDFINSKYGNGELGSCFVFPADDYKSYIKIIEVR